LANLSPTTPAPPSPFLRRLDDLRARVGWARLCSALILVLCAVCAWRPIAGGMDFWAHASIGRWILENGTVPRQSLWVWGAEPTPWIAHSWGSQVAFAAIMRAGEGVGPILAVAACVLCACATFGLLWRETLRDLARRNLEPDLLLLALYVLAIMCAAARFKPRPELFTALFVTAQLLFWLAWRRSPRGLPWHHCAALVAMWALWANVHGAWAFGLVLWALTLAGDGAQDRFDTRWHKLFFVGSCCAAATLLNPYGAEVWEGLRSVRSSTFKQIEEWKPPWEWPALPIEWIWGEILLAVGAFVAWVYDPKRRWAHLLWIAFAVASFCAARRGLWLSALVHMAVLAHSGGALQRPWWIALKQRRRVRPALDLAALAMLAAVIAGQTPRDLLSAGAVSRTAPTELSRAARRIEREQFRARGRAMRPFNDYEFSSYWQWAFAGRPPLFIDLLNAYPDQLMDDYFSVLRREPRGKARLAQANAVFLRPAREDELVGKFKQHLESRPQEWKRAYQGRDGTIWLRR
jgi:hypothetical protein